MGLTDDAALIDVPVGQQLVVTMDGMVSGVHFLADDPPDLVARKLLRVNLSDLAAMGATPLAYTLCAAFCREVTDSWIAAFASGLATDQAAFGISLIGGDTVSTPGPGMFTLTAMGTLATGKALCRNGAQEGDDIYASGTIGDGAVGLLVLKERDELIALSPEDRRFLAGRYRLPKPRLALGKALVGVASAALDVSDGLAADLGHLCNMSALGARIEIEKVPVSAACRHAIALSQLAASSVLGGGDDYELLFTAPPERAAEVLERAKGVGTPVAVIGKMVAGRGVIIVDASGSAVPIESTGYQHF
jgi:thiamine-monophosphate kinase